MVPFVDATDLEDRSPTRRETFMSSEMANLHRFLNTIMRTPSAGLADICSGLALQLRDLIEEQENELRQKAYRKAGFNPNRP